MTTKTAFHERAIFVRLGSQNWDIESVAVARTSVIPALMASLLCTAGLRENRSKRGAVAAFGVCPISATAVLKRR